MKLMNRMKYLKKKITTGDSTYLNLLEMKPIPTLKFVLKII